jgi:hypothetical protein
MAFHHPPLAGAELLVELPARFLVAGLPSPARSPPAISPALMGRVVASRQSPITTNL